METVFSSETPEYPITTRCRNLKDGLEGHHFERFITFDNFKSSGLVDTRQRRFERHTVLNHQRKKGVLIIVVAITHGTSIHDQNIAINTHSINMKYHLIYLGIIYIPTFYVILQFF
jgi:hypothetical protein